MALLMSLRVVLGGVPVPSVPAEKNSRSVFPEVCLLAVGMLDGFEWVGSPCCKLVGWLHTTDQGAVLLPGLKQSDGMREEVLIFIPNCLKRDVWIVLRTI